METKQWDEMSLHEKTDFLLNKAETALGSTAIDALATDLRGAISGLRSELNSISQDIATMKSDVAKLKGGS